MKWKKTTDKDYTIGVANQSEYLLKYTSLAPFTKHLEGALPNHFAELYVVLSKEPYVREEGVRRLTTLLFQDAKSRQLGVYSFDANEHKVDLILEELLTLTFFSIRRAIVIQNVDKFTKEAMGKLQDYFTNPSQDVILILVASTINRATNFYKQAEKVGVLLDVPEEKPWEKEKNTIDWLVSQSSHHGKILSHATAQRLVKQLGTDQQLLSNELQKLLCFIDNRKSIEDSDINAICCSGNTDNIWQLAEAIFKRDTSASIVIASHLLKSGVAIIALLRQIRTQFQTGYQICSILAGGGTSHDVNQEYPYMKNAILERNIQQSTQFGAHKFKSGILAIDAAEMLAKNSTGEPEFIMNILLVKLAER